MCFKCTFPRKERESYSSGSCLCSAAPVKTLGLKKVEAVVEAVVAAASSADIRIFSFIFFKKSGRSEVVTSTAAALYRYTYKIHPSDGGGNHDQEKRSPRLEFSTD